MSDNPYTVVIVGGGLVGSLAAVHLAKRGWTIHVYELRKDPRTQTTTSGRSINLALSVRGIESLKEAGVADGILQTLIPMRGRMIHTGNNQISSQPYGLHGECINSVDRKFMNEHLLSAAEALPNVRVFFEHAFLKANLDRKTVVFQRKDGNEINVHADLIIGADGAYSKIRSVLMRSVRMDFAQTYIDHAYVELNIPPTLDDQYAMDHNHLHIWPRHTFMMIALPNRDKSFTVTLFMPCKKLHFQKLGEEFELIKEEADLISFFENTFPDALKLMGRDLLVKEYFKNPKGSLVSVKCKPYHYKDRLILIGDAAHAMVPFYGQGMNCGFEDLSVLTQILEKYLGPVEDSPTTEFLNFKAPSSKKIQAALAEYSQVRNPDVEAMCDLALHNYEEMRSSVIRPLYLIRKKLEGFLNYFFPSRVIPLYTMVSFTRLPYSTVVKNYSAQNQIYSYIYQGAINIGVISLIGMGIWWSVSRPKFSFRI